ncbi:MAG: cardiolipin synthase [Desulfobacterales bacterium]|nr:cardiolipin synthase [Desulfobacterales bacterium]
MISDAITLLITVIIPLFELLGIATAVHAIVNVRTSQGSIAWAVSLVTFPWVALPLYWVFGRRRFSGYIEVLRQGRLEHEKQTNEVMCQLQKTHVSEKKIRPGVFKVFENLAGFPFTNGNDIKLLIDGPATFQSMFQSINMAKEYILLQYFIVHDDELGRELKSRLIARSGEGIRIYFLYDEIGCHKLPGRYIQDLKDAGIEISGFRTTRGRGNRFQINFRNHRKITIIDGKTAFVGGHNIGDEYMGRDPKYGRWRDTHIRIEGPAVRNIQLSFVGDWYWANRTTFTLNWNTPPQLSNGSDVLVLPTGPADHMENCSLMFVHAIHSARKRIWLASPYFIPSEATIKALQTASLRDIEIRIMLPMNPDHRTVYMAGFSYLAQLDIPGITFYRYVPGFLHQKVFLIDDMLAAVGTANMDNRSFRLNFEITALISDKKFVKQVEEMLETDFSQCRIAKADEYLKRGFLFRFGVKLARLLSPIL